MLHFVRSKNMPYSVENVRAVVRACQVCSEMKPKFIWRTPQTLIKASQAFERLSVDFKGPLPSSSRNRYKLTVVDEYSRFPFAFPCADVAAATVIKYLTNLFSVFGNPSFVHSDRGTAFMSEEFLHSRGIANSRTTAFNPQGNGQVERYNSIIWQMVSLARRLIGKRCWMWLSTASGYYFPLPLTVLHMNAYSIPKENQLLESPYLHG